MSANAYRISAPLGFAALLITAVPSRAPAQPVTATWTGTSGNWTNPNIWATTPISGLFPNNGQPTAATTYTVQISGTGSITLDTSITVDQLSFGSGTVAAPSAGPLNALVVNNNLTWSGGTFLGVNGANNIAINANGGITFPGGGLPVLDAAALFIRGTTSTWSGGNITLQNGAFLANSSGSTLTASGNGTINLGGTSTLTSIGNSGIFIKSGGAGTTTIVPPVTNNGVFEAATGVLQTTGGIFTNNGTLLAAGGTIQINGPLNNLISGTLSGGIYQVQANSSLILSGTVTTIGPNTTVELDGANSNFPSINSVSAINGTFRLTGDRLFSTAGGLSLGSAGLPTPGVLDVQSGSNFSVNGNLVVAGSSQILNGAVSVFGTTAVNNLLAVGAGASLLGSQLLTVGTPGTLAVQGTVGQPVMVAGVLTGGGHVTGPTFIQPGGFLRPGNSPGTIGLDGGLTLDGNYDWDLNGNDNTMAGGTFDKVKSGGVVTLGVMSQINIKVGGAVDFTNPFWSTSEVWSAIAAPVGFADATIPALTVSTNSYLVQYPNGAFSLSEQPNSLNVVWEPFPVLLTWTGTNSGSWNNANNWSPVFVPTSSPDTQLTFGGTPNPAMTNDIPGTLTLNSMTFNSGSPVYTLSGNGLNFQTSSIGNLPQIVQNSTNGVTMSVAMTLTNNLTVSGAGNLTLNGAIGGAGSLTYNGAATLVLGNAANNYGGGTNIQHGTVQVAADGALGAGNVTVAALGLLTYTSSTSTTRTFTLNNGMVSVAAAQTLTLNGAQVIGGFLSGPGTFATNAISGASFSGVTTRPSATLNSNSSLDQFVNDTNGGTLNVATSLASPVVFSGMTNAGSGSITVGSKSTVRVTDFQSYGLVNVTNGASAVSTTLANAGTSAMFFNAGSRTFIGTVGGNGLADLELNGQNAIVAGGLLVNNGQVTDMTAGFATIVADFGGLVKGGGSYFNPVKTQNGGKFQSGNSPGLATFGRFIFGPGGVNNYIFAISNATGTAGPTPDANNQVSGWGLVKTSHLQRSVDTTSGDFAWTADSTNKLTVTLDTLVNPTIAGTDVPGLMANFDPTRSYSWPAVEWVGGYIGPTNVAALDAATTFDTSEFANPIAGTFGWSLDPARQTLSLTYTPSAVPEPGTLALVGAAAALGWRRIRRRGAR